MTGGAPRAGARAAALVAALAGALAVRVGVAGGDGVRSVAAGAVFAVLLLAVVALADRGLLLRPGPWRRQAAVGALGAVVLCVVPFVVHLRSGAPPLPAAGFAGWAVVVGAVAVGEEALLRGALWEALVAAGGERRGEWLALAVSTVAFGLLHVPLYGWSVLVLDLVVGLLLGGVRMVGAGWGGPAVAHTLADLAGWWLR